MKILGLVGGTSWVSTIDYYRYINEGINKKLGGLDYPPFIIYSINHGEFVKNNTAGDWDATFRLLAEAGENLKRAGAQAIVLCANTSHAVADRVEEKVQLPVIHIATATAEVINQQNL